MEVAARPAKFGRLVKSAEAEMAALETKQMAVEELASDLERGIRHLARAKDAVVAGVGDMEVFPLGCDLACASTVCQLARRPSLENNLPHTHTKFHARS